MKVFAISDLHLCISGAKPMEIFGEDWANYQENIKKDWQEKVSDEDIVLVCGDISWAMKLKEAEKDIEYFENLPGKKIFIRGNHDYWWQSISNVRSMLPVNCYALQNDAIKIGDYIICGTRGWIVPDGNNFTEQDQKLYNRELIRLDMALSSAKRLQQANEQIICMTHYPPINNNKEKNEVVDILSKYSVNACVFGHIHSHMGKYKIYEQQFGINFYLTSCDLLKNKLYQIY